MSTDDGVRTTEEPGETVERAVERLGWAFGSDETNHGGHAGAGGARADRLEQLLLQQASGPKEKPYLAAVPSGYAAETVVFDWLEFLMARGGYKSAVEALRYYRRIGWLTEEAERDLGEYLLGFPEPSESSETLGVDDHQQSLVYVAKLAGLY